MPASTRTRAAIALRRASSRARTGCGTSRKRLFSMEARSRPPTVIRSASQPQARPDESRTIGSGACTDAIASVVVEAFLDQLFLDLAPIRVKGRVLEVLLELEIDRVLAGPVLLDGQDRPVTEALRLVRVELDVHLGHDAVLLVEDQDHVGFVVQGR